MIRYTALNWRVLLSIILKNLCNLPSLSAETRWAILDIECIKTCGYDTNLSTISISQTSSCLKHLNKLYSRRKTDMIIWAAYLKCLPSVTAILSLTTKFLQKASESQGRARSHLTYVSGRLDTSAGSKRLTAPFQHHG